MIFKRICDFETKDLQDTFIQSLIEARRVTRHRKRNEESTRTVQSTYKYYTMVGETRTEVCLKAFCSLHCRTKKQVRRLQQLLLIAKSPKDGRGAHIKYAIPPETLLLVREHIESFPTYESHYLGTVIKYLDERLNITDIYKMFKNKNPSARIGKSAFFYYYKNQYNLKFGPPQVDICSTCEVLDVKIKNSHLSDATRRVAVAEKLVHRRRAKKFYHQIKSDTEDKNPKILSLSFDYMQNLTVPLIPVQETYYLCQVNINVFCIHNNKKNNAKIYLYHEGQGRKGPNEVCSFLMDYLDNEISDEVEELHIYSDNCGGQNKNHALSRLLCALTDTGRFKEIKHYYPVKGHSYLPCDRDFSLIKRSLKKLDRLYSINQIIHSIVHCTTNLNKFTVKLVQTSEILDYKNWWPHYYTKTPVSEETRGRKTKKKDKVCFSISSFSEFTYNKQLRGIVTARAFIHGLTKHTFKLSSRGLPILLPSIPAYESKIPIKKRKIDDVRKLSPYIPIKYRRFFNELTSWPTTTGEVNDDD